MQIKANAKTFGYDLIGDLSEIMLNFIENIHDIDVHIIEILSAYQKTLHIILIKKLKGS